MAPQENQDIVVYVDGVASLDPATDGITFESSNTEVVTVSTAGRISAIAAGDAVITVTLGSDIITINVTVQ